MILSRRITAASGVYPPEIPLAVAMISGITFQ